jgi:hypothetical protein
MLSINPFMVASSNAAKEAAAKEGVAAKPYRFVNGHRALVRGRLTSCHRQTAAPTTARIKQRNIRAKSRLLDLC